MSNTATRPPQANASTSKTAIDNRSRVSTHANTSVMVQHLQEKFNVCFAGLTSLKNRIVTAGDNNVKAFGVAFEEDLDNLSSILIDMQQFPTGGWDLHYEDPRTWIPELQRLPLSLLSRIVSKIPKVHAVVSRIAAPIETEVRRDQGAADDGKATAPTSNKPEVMIIDDDGLVWIINQPKCEACARLQRECVRAEKQGEGGRCKACKKRKTKCSLVTMNTSSKKSKKVTVPEANDDNAMQVDPPQDPPTGKLKRKQADLSPDALTTRLPHKLEGTIVSRPRQQPTSNSPLPENSHVPHELPPSTALPSAICLASCTHRLQIEILESQLQDSHRDISRLRDELRDQEVELNTRFNNQRVFYMQRIVDLETEVQRWKANTRQ